MSQITVESRGPNLVAKQQLVVPPIDIQKAAKAKVQPKNRRSPKAQKHFTEDRDEARKQIQVTEV